MDSIGAGMMVLLFFFGVVLAVCWLVLPFALIGTKPLLRQMLKQQEDTNALLRQLLEFRRP
jgi:predicted PurR-regulated permease PerM